MTVDLWDSYKDLTTHIIPGPNSITYFIPLFLFPIALLIPPTVLSRLQLSCLFLPMIYGCIIHTWVKGGGIDVISANVVLWSTVLIALQDPRGTYKRIHVQALSPLTSPKVKIRESKPLIPVEDQDVPLPSEAKDWEEDYPADLYKRLCWVLTLLISIRLSYWKIGDLNHDKLQPPARQTRRAFLTWAAIIIVQSYTILDIAAFYSHHDPYFVQPNIGIDMPLSLDSTAPRFLSLLHIIPPRVIRSSAIAAQIYGVITLGGALGIPLIVVVNWLGLISDVWSPQTWPVWFGPFSAIADRGMRGLWGTWWHQTMRYTTSIPGRSLAQALRVPTHSLKDYSLRTISAFFFSGIVHMGLVPPEPRYATLPTYQVRLYIAMFFWCQAVGFGVELFVSKLTKRFCPDVIQSRVAKALTLGWVIFWLCLTLPIVGVGLKQLGYGKVYPVPISILRGLTGNGWLTWVRK